jgi:hypothetical protein
VDDDESRSPAMENAAEINDRRVLALLDRNDRILRGLHQLRGYHLAPIALLPSVLDRVSDLPTPYVQVSCDGATSMHCATSSSHARRGQQQKRSSDSNKNGTKKKRGPPDSPPAMIRPRRDSRHLLGKAPWP